MANRRNRTWRRHNPHHAKWHYRDEAPRTMPGRPPFDWKGYIMWKSKQVQLLNGTDGQYLSK